ncbi:MAG: hypothetical protein JNK85_10035 [Verrucomicrobiales bacterium]|nr:hypothetical protein [Verrucomicrobiales bacterium]
MKSTRRQWGGGFMPCRVGIWFVSGTRRSLVKVALLAIGSAIWWSGPPSMAGSDGSSDKRVENRGTPAESSARPVGVTPGSAPAKPSTDGSPGKCETQPPTPTETTQVEETKVVEVQETVVVEVQPVFIEAPSTMAFAEIVQNTLGRPRAAAVTACLDPRYPLPSYAMVGIQPPFNPSTGNSSVRLQRFDCEVETDGNWQPTQYVLTLMVGTSRLEMVMSQESHPETLLVQDAVNGRRYPVTVSVTRSAGLAQGARHVVSFQFPNAASGGSPTLRPGEGVYLSIDLTAAAPPGTPMPRFLLVKGSAGSESSLLLVEKSGTATSVVPALNAMELSAHCSVIHLVRP